MNGRLYHLYTCEPTSGDGDVDSPAGGGRRLNRSPSTFSFNHTFGWKGEYFIFIFFYYTSNKIRCSPIKGIESTNAQNNASTNNTRKTQQFADDTTLLLKDQTDLDIAMKIFKDFAKLSGLTMNKQKTSAMWLGSFKIDKKILTILN